MGFRCSSILSFTSSQPVTFDQIAKGDWYGTTNTFDSEKEEPMALVSKVRNAYISKKLPT